MSARSTRDFKTSLSAEHLRSIFSYDPSNGEFRWKNPAPPNPNKHGSLAGWIDKRGYCNIRVNYSAYRAHRLAWLYVYGEWPTALVDHIDRNPTNNAIANLRLATNSQNGHNRSAKGFYITRQGKYVPVITLHGRRVRLGLFETESMARAAYIAAKRTYCGEFSPIDGASS